MINGAHALEAVGHLAPTSCRRTQELAVELASLINGDLEARGSDRQLCRLHAGNFVATKWPMNVLVRSAMSSAASFKRSIAAMRRWNIAVWGGSGTISTPSRAPSAAASSFARDELGHPRQDLVEAPLCRDQERVCRE